MALLVTQKCRAEKCNCGYLHDTIQAGNINRVSDERKSAGYEYPQFDCLYNNRVKLECRQDYGLGRREAN